MAVKNEKKTALHAYEIKYESTLKLQGWKIGCISKSEVHQVCDSARGSTASKKRKEMYNNWLVEREDSPTCTSFSKIQHN